MAHTIKLNIGGSIMETTMETLRNRPDTGLSFMFSEKNTKMLKTQNDGSIFIDADPNIFSHILQLYRTPKLSPMVVPEGISKEEWYQELDRWCIPNGENISNEIISPIDVRAEIIHKFMLLLNQNKEYIDCLKGNKNRFDMLLIPGCNVISMSLGQVELYDWFKCLFEIHSSAKVNQLFGPYFVSLTKNSVEAHNKCAYPYCEYCARQNLKIVARKQISDELLTEMETKKTLLLCIRIEPLWNSICS